MSPTNIIRHPGNTFYFLIHQIIELCNCKNKPNPKPTSKFAK